MTRATERFHFIKPILNATKLGFVRLSAYNSVFNLTEKNNKFSYSQKFLKNSFSVASTGAV